MLLYEMHVITDPELFKLRSEKRRVTGLQGFFFLERQFLFPGFQNCVSGV